MDRLGRPSAGVGSAHDVRRGDESPAPRSAASALRCRRKFLRIFPNGFRDADYTAWERDYKWETHQRWIEQLDQKTYRSLLRKEEYQRIATLAVGIEAHAALRTLAQSSCPGVPVVQ